MDKHQILTSTYLDLVFDGRNKNYGSYVLRRSYARRMRQAGLFLLLIASSAAGYKVMAERPGRDKTLTMPEITTTLSDVHIAQPDPKPELKLPEPAAAAAPVKTEQFTLPDVTRDQDVPDDKTLASQDDLKDAVAAKLHMDGDSSFNASPDIIDPHAKGGGGGGKEVIETNGGNDPGKKKIATFVDQQPEFPGGDEMLNKYLSSNLNYPEAASNASQQGNVRVKFVVNEDGSISDITIVRGFGYGSETEAMRVVSGMPKWKPGKNNGIPVKVWFQLPIRFVLND